MKEKSTEFVGDQDGYQRLWTPHRLVYIQSGQQPADSDCPFCIGPTRSDAESLIVRRGVHCFVVLNLYPYNSGHLLICPYRHVDTYDKATTDEITEMAVLTQQAMSVLKAVNGAHGFNIGMNQGQVAGAGIAAHLHQHVVPRWNNDANFFPIIAQTKALPKLLGEVQQEISTAWSGLFDIEHH
ncbi:MAG: HIT family protein [Microbacteriaceae bacterium]